MSEARKKRYFGTDGIRGKVGEYPITPEFILKLGWAIGRVMKRDGKDGILIGKDTRISGYMFESALQAGLSAAGVNVSLLGPMPTPGVAYLTRTLHAQAGIVISASHNPFYDNGIKLFSSEGTKLPDELEFAIEDELDKPMETVDSSQLGKAGRIVDAAGRYIEFCKSTIPSKIDLAGMKIVVDCAHGATYHIAPNVFKELGATVVTIGSEPNGLNINLDCGSTKPESLQAAVLEHRADIGVALDGDGDRLIMVDHKGEEVDGDEILFIIAESRRKTESLNGSVVGTVMSNLGLEHALQERGIGFERALVGDRYVMEVLKREGWVIGGESSGHILCLDRTSTGDGIISALQVISAMFESDSTLFELKSGMKKYPQHLVNVAADKTFDLAGSDVINQAIRDVEAELADSGRVLLRPSGTEPVVRVMVEGIEMTEVIRLANQLADVIIEAQINK
ncbi:Phosphoglucosamine mutase [hydrothermal vent metagenome]|uniref:Phosphoglucosamine mutase n=1 Tax=hydrothermal vent metagenome TaxID=652676 RepID=A0A3B0ZJH7_9ZZZZ